MSRRSSGRLDPRQCFRAERGAESDDHQDSWMRLFPRSSPIRTIAPSADDHCHRGQGPLEHWVRTREVARWGGRGFSAPGQHRTHQADGDGDVLPGQPLVCPVSGPEQRVVQAAPEGRRRSPVICPAVRRRTARRVDRLITSTRGTRQQSKQSDHGVGNQGRRARVVCRGDRNSTSGTPGCPGPPAAP